MRFGHQFMFQPDQKEDLKPEDFERAVKYKKEWGAADIGAMINECFGFTERTDKPLHWQIDIQAFPTDKWQEFKKKLLEWLQTASNSGLLTFNQIMVLKIIRELEEIGREKSEEINKKRNSV